MIKPTNRSRRIVLSTFITVPIATALGACVNNNRAGLWREPLGGAFDSIVDAALQPSSVRQHCGNSDQTPCYASIQAAVDAAPDTAPDTALTPHRIFIKRGRHHEKLEILKPNIHLIGEGRDRTIISFDAYAGQLRPDGKATWSTFGCSTIIVRAPGFVAKSLTIENTFDYLANDAKSPVDPSYLADPQAVALMLAKGSDYAQVHDVNIIGFQDTLFANAGRSYFQNCTVSGNVDFIFGAGQAFFDRCEIVCRPRNKLNVHPLGYVTAPSTQITEQFGLIFLHCKLLRENATVPKHSYALGRPWHPAATFLDGRYADPNAIGNSTFIDCYMDDHIHPDGWWSMTGIQKSGPTRTTFYPQDARFFEFNSHGPGAQNANPVTRRKLSEMEAKIYSVQQVLRGWQPA